MFCYNCVNTHILNHILVGLSQACCTTKMWSATLKRTLRHKAAPVVINNLLLQMEWLLQHLQSNRTRDNNTGKLTFTVTCAHESQGNKSIAPHSIKFHGDKQLLNTVFNLKTSLTSALKYDLSCHLSWAACVQIDRWQTLVAKLALLTPLLSRLLSGQSY